MFKCCVPFFLHLFLYLYSKHPFHFSCIWDLCMFLLRLLLLLIFFFFPHLSRTNCWSRDCGSPARSLACLLWKRCARVQDSVDYSLSLFWGPSVPCLEMPAFIPGNDVTVQLNFSSVFTLPVELEGEGTGFIPVI